MHRAGLRHLFAVFVLGATLGGRYLAGCSSPTGFHASPVVSKPELLRATTGVVTGRYLMEGGPISPQTHQTADPWPIPGRVTFSGPRASLTVKVSSDGSLSLRLPAGVYAVSAETGWLDMSPAAESPCYLPQTVTVQAAGATSVTVYCPVP
jgi:hypothetical protein